MALARPDLCGYQLRYDQFRAEIMLAPAGTDDWRSFNDTDYVELAIRLERNGRSFEDIPKERFRDAVAFAAERARFDTAARWLESLHWDGVRRVETFLIVYFSADDTPYIRAVSLYLWTALAGRTLRPGIQVDMVPVAVGPQGTGKSTAVAAIVPSPDFFLEIDFGEKEADLSRMMRGKLLLELGELKGLRRREAEHVKAFLTRRHEEWVPKFKEMQVRYPRRCVFFGTTNKDEFLADETGHRRWLPFRSGQCDPSGVANDREQLWAEARELFMQGGVAWADAEHLAKAEYEAYVVRDPWEEPVESWLTTPDSVSGERPLDRPITAAQALSQAVNMQTHAQSQSAKDRMARVLTELGPRLGFAAKRTYIDGTRARAYVRRE